MMIFLMSISSSSSSDYDLFWLPLILTIEIRQRPHLESLHNFQLGIHTYLSLNFKQNHSLSIYSLLIGA